MKKKIFMLIVLLMSLLLVVLFYSYIEFPKNDYSNSNYPFENYQRFNNTEITFKAKIKEINQINKTIVANIIDPPYKSVEIKTKTMEPKLHNDDVLFVIGVLQGEKTVFAEKILIKGPWDDTLVFLRSIPAIPFVLYLFFRTWRFDRKTFRFERRIKNA